MTAACGGEINAGEGRKEKSENAELVINTVGSLHEKGARVNKYSRLEKPRRIREMSVSPQT